MFSNNYNLRLYVIIFFLLTVTSCGSGRWYSIGQEPAKPIAYIRGGVFVSGEYVRSASIAEIDGKESAMHSEQNFQIPIGTRRITINCDEAKGSYDSKEFTGQSKILEFDAETEKIYRVWCKPYTHWWIEEIATKKTVAGLRPDSLNGK